MVNIKILTFLLAHSFLINSCLSSSSINAKNKFVGVTHLLHMCVVFLLVSIKSNCREEKKTGDKAT